MAHTVSYSNGTLFVYNEAGDVVVKQDFLPPSGEDHQARPFESEEQAMEFYEQYFSGQYPKASPETLTE